MFKRFIFAFIFCSIVMILVACGGGNGTTSSKVPNNAIELTQKNVTKFLGASATFNKAGTTSQSDMAIVTISSNGSNEFYDTIVKVKVTGGRGAGDDDNIVNITLDKNGNGTAKVSLNPMVYASVGGCKIINVKGKVVENDPFKK